MLITITCCIQLNFVLRIAFYNRLLFEKGKFKMPDHKSKGRFILGFLTLLELIGKLIHFCISIKDKISQAVACSEAVFADGLGIVHVTFHFTEKSLLNLSDYYCGSYSSLCLEACHVHAGVCLPG